MIVEHQMYDGRILRLKNAMLFDEDERELDYQGFWAWCPTVPKGCDKYLPATRGFYCLNAGQAPIGRELKKGALSLVIAGEICEVKRMTLIAG